MTIKTIKEDIILENKHLLIKNNLVIFPDGSKGTHIKISTIEQDGAFVLPVSESGQVALIREYRYARNKYYWKGIAGGIAKKEKPDNAAKREMLEEAGIVCDELILAGKFVSSPGTNTGSAYLYLAMNAKIVQSSTPEGSESITDVKFFDVEDALSIMRKDGESDIYSSYLIEKIKNMRLTK